MIPHLLVYGTLRNHPDHPMFKVLEREATFVGVATVPGLLYDLGRFPGAVPALEPAALIRGEVYRLHDPEAILPALDAYEGCGPADPLPHRFERAPAQVRLHSGEPVTAWVYWYRGGLNNASPIPSGDYLTTR